MNKFVQQVVVEAVQEQPWFKRNANTIVAGIGAVTSALSFLVALEVGLPDAVTGAMQAAIAFLTAVGIKFTRNGVQGSTAAKLDHTPTARADAHEQEIQAIESEAQRSRASAEESELEVEAQRWTAPYVGEHRAE